MENKSIFKVGDKVYDIRFGWGEVIKLYSPNVTYSIEVAFGSGREETYTLKGFYLLEDKTPLLPFTEYTLQSFSQEKPFNPQDCVGKWCLVWDEEVPNPKKGRFTKITEYDYSHCPFRDSEGVYWNNAKPLTEEQLKAFNLTND